MPCITSFKSLSESWQLLFDTEISSSHLLHQLKALVTVTLGLLLLSKNINKQRPNNQHRKKKHT